MTRFSHKLALASLISVVGINAAQAFPGSNFPFLGPNSQNCPPGSVVARSGACGINTSSPGYVAPGTGTYITTPTPGLVASNPTPPPASVASNPTPNPAGGGGPAPAPVTTPPAPPPAAPNPVTPTATPTLCWTDFVPVTSYVYGTNIVVPTQWVYFKLFLSNGTIIQVGTFPNNMSPDAFQSWEKSNQNNDQMKKAYPYITIPRC